MERISCSLRRDATDSISLFVIREINCWLAVVASWWIAERAVDLKENNTNLKSKFDWKMYVMPAVQGQQALMASLTEGKSPREKTLFDPAYSESGQNTSQLYHSSSTY